MKKVLTYVLSMVMVAALAIGGTLAYLTDKDSETNIFTSGNVEIILNEEFEQGSQLIPGEKIDKVATITNTGKNDAWVWMTVAVPYDLKDVVDWTIGAPNSWTNKDTVKVEINGKDYALTTLLYNSLLEAGATTAKGITEVALDSKVDIDVNGDWAIIENGTATDISWNSNEDENPFIYVSAYAIQNEGFANVGAAYDAYKAQWGTNGDGYKAVTVVDTAEELVDALTTGEDVILTKDVILETNENVKIEAGTTATLDLNGHTLSGLNTNTNTHNFLIDVKGGTLNITNGTVSMEHTGSNMGWNGATTVIDVTAGGELNLDGVTVVNEGGTDMNFGIHLNNWGEVTLNIENSTINSNYCAVRVFNSGPDMNNVSINNSKLVGNTRAFWVHNYCSSDFSGKTYSGSSQTYDKDVVDNRLNLDIYNNNNVFEITGTAKSPIRYGFNETIFFDGAGNEVK